MKWNMIASCALLSVLLSLPLSAEEHFSGQPNRAE
jgi:hypothetical protein